MSGNILPYTQIVLSVLLIGAVLLQQRGSGLGSAFGGESTAYSSRRGIEKKLYWGTFTIAVILFGSILISFLF